MLNRTHISGAARSCPGSSVCEPSCKLVTIEAMLSTLACVAFLVVQLVAHSGCDQTAFLVAVLKPSSGDGDFYTREDYWAEDVVS